MSRDVDEENLGSFLKAVNRRVTCHVKAGDACVDGKDLRAAMDIVCPESHALILTNSNYLNQYTTGLWFCDKCKMFGRASFARWCCENCAYDVCMDCYLRESPNEKREILVPAASFGYTHKGIYSVLALFNLSGYKCDVCNKSYDRGYPSYGCHSAVRQCDYDVCLDCARRLIASK